MRQQVHYTMTYVQSKCPLLDIHRNEELCVRACYKEVECLF